MLDWMSSNAWIVWIVLAGGLAVSEMLTLDLTLLMLGGGALAGGLTGLVLPGALWAQVLVAVVVALVLMFVLRPVLLSRLRNSPGYQTAFDKLLGNSGRAVGMITPSGGEVKIAGETWSARSYDGAIIADGTEVEVLEVDGVVLVVFPRHLPLTGRNNVG